LLLTGETGLYMLFNILVDAGPVVRGSYLDVGFQSGIVTSKYAIVGFA